MESEAAYKEEIHRILEANVRPLALIDTAIMLLSASIVLCLVKLVQAASIAW